jgi:D-alanyl-D-alanine endopeptidase (penicillin-binding protein 7)
MKHLRVWAAVALVTIIFVGYAREQSQTEATPEPAAPGAPEAAVPVFPEEPAYLPAGPWASYTPPRKMRPKLRSYAACVVDCNTGAVLYGRRAHEVRPIASIIKLLTAMVYLESGGDLNQEIEITPEDARGAGKSILWKGHRFKAHDVLYTALMSSENRAARALARSTPYSREQFVERMQKRAREIGCKTLQVVEPTGLSENNVASATDVARLLTAALANPTIREVCRTYRHQFKALNSRKQYRLTNSNRLLTSKYKVRGGKTGYIVEAGWCLANMIETPDGPLVTVVLHSRSNSWRFTDSRRLIEWALKYRRKAPAAFALAQ